MLILEQRVLIELLAGEISGETRLDDIELKSVDWAQVLQEAKSQAVILMAAEALVKYRKYISNYSDWENTAFTAHMLNVRAAYNEQQLNEIMKGYPFFILKGLAAALYYPKPHERSLGDIDFLIDKSQRTEIEILLSKNGYKSWDKEHICHTVFKKEDAHLEMHFEISGIPYGEPGTIVREFMMNAVKHRIMTGFDEWRFPVPEDIYHGLIILLHMQHHMLGEGLGLRHICDWACYLQKTANKPFWTELLNVFEKIGILTYAKVVSKISAMYFRIKCPEWAQSADENLCVDVMNDILEGGNFGRKDTIRSKSSMMISNHGKNGTKGSRLSNLFQTLHVSTPTVYPIVKKYAVLYPLFDCYRVLLYIIKMIKGERSSFTKLASKAAERKNVYDRLHIFEIDNKMK